MPRRRVKKQQRLQGEGFWDTITSWGRTLRDYPKLIIDGPVATPQGSTASPGLPDKSILKDIADNSYKGTSDEMKDIAGYTLKLKTPTLVIYQKDGENVMVIGVRGTADFRDFRAWFSTAFNVIPDSQRFKEDIAEISKFQQQYPLSSFTYYATGHSLGGTLIDELIKKGMVKEARTYNPAIETDDIPNVALSQKNHRIYADGDPLYLLQGRYDNPTEVRKSYKYYPASAYDFVPGYDKYKQHVLANPVFVGGKTKGKKVVMEPKDYYTEHRNIVSLLDKTGKVLQREAKDQKVEATQMAKKLGHTNPFYHLQGAGMMANSQFYRTDPKRNPLLRGEGIWDDIKSGIEKVVGKPPASAHHVWTPAEQADINRRQHIQDVDKQRAKMVASKKQVAIDDIMGYAQHPNALKAIYAREGTDNAKDYLARVVEKATAQAERFYPY